jgi:Cu2+-exporting ATPase
MRLIEQALISDDQVKSARVNMTSEQVTFAWDGARCDGDRLCQKVEKLGYKLHPIDEAAEKGAETQKQLLKAIAISGFAAANMMLISIALWSSSGETMGYATRDLFHWVSALIALPTVIYAGQPFFKSAISILKERHTNMDVPISLAVVLAAVMSLSETMRGGEYVYFDSAVMLLFFLLIGRYLDLKARGQARASASKLLSKLQGFATKIVKDGTSRIAMRDIQVGDRLLVTAGDSIPADGIVVEGASDIDMSLVTGETNPETVKASSRVFAGTLNLSAPIEMEVSEVSEKSLLSEVVKLLETAEQSNADYVRLADKAAKLYTPVVHSLGALTFVGWWLLMSAPWQVSLLHAVTVLIITCPCALGLAVPVVQVLASGRLMKNGVLLKSGDALERLAKVDTIVFDKTGTLTRGRPVLSGGPYDDNMLKIAASLAHKSRHPLSKALAEHYIGERIEDLSIEEIAGKIGVVMKLFRQVTGWRYGSPLTACRPRFSILKINYGLMPRRSSMI